jgi:hypothetical protein
VPKTSNVFNDGRILLCDSFASKINLQFSVIEQMVNLKIQAISMGGTNPIVCCQDNRLEVNRLDVFCL